MTASEIRETLDGIEQGAGRHLSLGLFDARTTTGMIRQLAQVCRAQQHQIARLTEAHGT